MSQQLIVGLILSLMLLSNWQHCVNAAAYHEIFKHDEYPNKCVVPSPTGDKLIIDSDRSANYPGKCAEIYCGRNSFALVYTCEAEDLPDGCQFAEYVNTDGPFPDCCRRRLDCNMV